MKNIFNIGLIALSLMVAASCSKFLDRAPLSIPTDDNFWNSEAEANSGIAGGYSMVRKSLNEAMAFYAYGDLPTDEFMNNLPGEDFGDIGRMNWSVPIPFAQVHRPMMKLRRFDNFYKSVDQANRCIKFISDIPLSSFTSSNKELAKNRLLGEAYFLRAFNYLYLARVWGDVPLVLETTTDLAKAQFVPRAPQADVLKQVITDINTAIPLLTWNYASTNDRAVRANRGAAFALLAHVYAWMGDYEKSAVAADSVITKGGYALVNRNSYLNIFKGKSTEGIFEIAQSADNEGASMGTDANASIAGKTLKTPYNLTRAGNAFYTLDRVTLNALYPDTNDLRVRNGFAFFNTTDPISIKYSNVKYTATTSSGQPSSPIALNNIIVFRLADIMLLRAEALAATGNFGPARTLLNTVRSAANAGASTATDAKLLEAIFDERARELFLEGHRFYDLVRLARKTGILKFSGNRMSSGEFQQGKYYWPIDPILLSSNPTLTQTPFWSDKM
jgi:starch-binding outer membrane protein, SusD/RagB family